MSPVFGKKKGTAGKTVAILDIESGSVGAALARISPHEAPKLFAETRISLPIHKTRDSVALARAVEVAAEQALLHVSGVATRMREHEALRHQGEVGRVAVFMSPPWATMHLAGGTADFAEPVQHMARGVSRSLFGEVPTSFHPLGSAAAHGNALIFPSDSANLLCIVGGEVSELLVLNNHTVFGHATVPLGQHALMRTLISHGNVSPAEAESFLRLANREGHVLSEPMRVVEDHVAALVAQAADEARADKALSGVVVLAHEPISGIVARALSREKNLAQLFPAGGTVRSLRASHAMPYFTAHAPRPDVNLMLEALFIDGKFSA